MALSPSIRSFPVRGQQKLRPLESERIRPYVRPPSWDVDRYDTESALNVQFWGKQKMSFSARGRSVKIEEDVPKFGFYFLDER